MKRVLRSLTMPSAAPGGWVMPVAGIVAGPLALAALGVTHPTDLTPATAPYWRDLHVALVILFPLLGVNLWWLLSGIPGPAAWLARAGGLVYMAFYGALDVLAGIGTGLLVADAGVPADGELTSLLFSAGNALAEIGVWALLLACIIASILIVARVGRRALVGGALLCAAALLFLQSHIYFPIGVATMLLMAVGFGWLQWARLSIPRAGSPDLAGADQR